MKNVLKIALKAAAALAIAAVCSGYIGGPKYNVEYKEVKVGAGYTLWEIADANYLNCKAGNMCFEEYLYNLRHDAKNDWLTANGRYLQPGDTVYVPVYKVVAK